MGRPLNLLDQRADPVEVKARPQAESARADLEGRRRSRLAPGGEGQAKEVVDNPLQGPSAPAHFRLKLGGNVVVKGQRRTHIVMLHHGHHDGKGPAQDAIGD
jgi:hypothetical protein